VTRTGELKLPTDPIAVQTSNKCEWNAIRSIDAADFYTVGYAGRTINDFIAVLQSAGVSTVIDVRQFAVSMYKPDFSKRNLQASLRSVEIDYLHIPEWGVPREVRSLAQGEPGRERIWAWYDSNVADDFRRNLHRFFNAAEHPVALLCVELDPTACHRHRLALALEQSGLCGYDL
jgi:uncharacterized protein (DUF488 family)